MNRSGRVNSFIACYLSVATFLLYYETTMSSHQCSNIGSPSTSALDEISLSSQISDITSTSPQQQTYVSGSLLPKHMDKEDLDIMEDYYTMWVPEGSLYLAFIPEEGYLDICKAMCPLRGP